MKTTVINQFTYTQSPEKLDFLEYQVLKNKDQLNYNLIIEKADGLTQEDINKISNIGVLEGVTKTENSNDNTTSIRTKKKNSREIRKNPLILELPIFFVVFLCCFFPFCSIFFWRQPTRATRVNFRWRPFLDLGG